MTRYILLFLTTVLLAHCADRKKLPKGVMDKEKMEEVMWDLMQADQFLSDFVLNRNDSLNRLEEHTSLYSDIFRLHNTNKEEFSQSFQYYRSHPALMREVLDSLSTRRLVTPIPAQPLPVDDTIRKKRIQFESKGLPNN